MTYEIGQLVPLSYRRSIVGDFLPTPRWHALTVPTGKERATREYFKRRGIHACFPERETTWIVRGKHYKRKFPVITQIVYVKFDREPQWDVLKSRHIVTGVFSRGSEPITLDKDIVAAVMGLPTEAERLEAARQELLRVRPKDKARLTSGPLSGFMVDVDQVAHGRAWFTMLTGAKGSASLSDIERVLPDEVE